MFVYCRSVLNIAVRSAEELLQVSSGLLIDGCVDLEDRADIIEEMMARTARQKRQVESDCSTTCSSVNDTMMEACLYDCFQAEGSEMQEEVRRHQVK